MSPPSFWPNGPGNASWEWAAVLFWGARGEASKWEACFFYSPLSPLWVHRPTLTNVLMCVSVGLQSQTSVHLWVWVCSHKHCCCCCSCLLHYFSCYPNHHKYAGICHFYPFRLFYAINIEFGKYICKKEPFSLQIPHCHSCSRQPAWAKLLSHFLMFSYDSWIVFFIVFV